MDFPSYLKSGEVARLFPVISDSGKEQKATSIFLSVLSAVPKFADGVLSQIGQRVGTRAIVNTFIEVVPAKSVIANKKDRPDGLIEVQVGKKRWLALVEAKIGTSKLDKNQVERYLQLARENGIDAVITISNEFSSSPTHSPVKVNKNLIRSVHLLHFSWTALLTNAVLMHEQGERLDTEQAFLIREFIRFFSHESAGVSGFTSMPPAWGEEIGHIQAGGFIQKGDNAADIVSAWYQELRDLALQMSRAIGCNISLKMSRAHESDPELRLKNGSEFLATHGKLESILEVPNAASDLFITADLRAKSIKVAMKLDAPKERKTTKARVNWLLRQLKDIKLNDVKVGVVWASRVATSYFSLEELLENPEIVNEVTTSSEVRAFEVIVTTSDTRRFKGRRTVIEDLEDLVPRFYEFLGQHLRAWNPSPPKPVHSVQEKGSTDPKNPPIAKSEAGIAGNAHNDLLEIPNFLKRISGQL